MKRKKIRHFIIAKKIRNLALLVLVGSYFFTFFLASPDISRAQVGETALSGDLNQYFHINLDKQTIAKGYTVTAFAEAIKLSLVPGILAEDTPVEVVALNEPMPQPWKVDRISPVYQFEFKNKAAYDNHKPFYIQLDYDVLGDRFKQVFYFDKNFDSWRPLPTVDYPAEGFVRSLIHLPFARIAVFSYPDVMGSGQASWYAYKPGNFAASPDFPKDSRLRVKNLENGKFVDIVVNDYGPDRYLHPDRVIDLEKNAFAAIASLGEGTVKVAIEPLYIAPDNSGRILGVASDGVTEEPKIALKAAVIINEASGSVLWQKNPTSTLPLASLTKLVAVKTFLDTKPSLNQVVAYSEQDAQYNYQYCKPWESAKLNIADGETLTIEDLIYVSLVGSANNTIESLVRVSGLSRANFIEKMNETVRSYGAEATTFYEPTGLDPQNVSSPLDYAIITKEVLKHPLIEKASTMAQYKFATVSHGVSHTIRNTNSIIRTNKYTVNGSKTGYLDEAGYCLMTRVKAGVDSNIIVVTFGADTRTQSFNETEDLIRYGLNKI